jgi:hypothetical protein
MMNKYCIAVMSVLIVGTCGEAVGVDSSLPPIVLQQCAPMFSAQSDRGNTVVANNSVVSTGQRSVVYYDISFVNISDKPATVVVVRIGGTDLANVGKFSPRTAVKWRIPAVPGPCALYVSRMVQNGPRRFPHLRRASHQHASYALRGNV